MDTFRVYKREFFKRPTLQVAPDLLGAVLCRRHADGSVSTARIIEVEAYTADDPASHAYRGLTERSSVMFGKPGIAYVYFIYGMYFCLNVVTEPKGVAGAVLIRAIETTGGDGPGKLCRLWNITKELNGVDLCDSGSPIWIGQGEPVEPDCIMTSARIGLSVAVEHPWRFYLKGHPGISGRGRSTPRKKLAKVEK